MFQDKTALYLAPSSFGFLFDECPRCFYLEALGILKRPRAPFPAIFTKIDSAMKRAFAEGWHRIEGCAHRFRVESQSGHVRSVALKPQVADMRLVIRGLFDSIVVFEDGSRAVCDFKTSPIKPHLIQKYSRQLHAYKLALEKPHAGISSRIDRLGLAVFEPDEFASPNPSRADLSGRLVWVDVKVDDSGFEVFLDRVADLLALSEPPASDPRCPFCVFQRLEVA